MPKIGIIGGTFDPIHNGHIEMAKKARERLGLSKVLFITGGNTPHKKDKDVTEASVRHEMVKKAVAKNRNFEAVDYEVKKETYSYTAETLEYLKENNPGNDYYFILGADSLDYIDSWYRPETIFAIAKLVVFSRRNYKCREKTDELIKKFNGQVIIMNEEIPDVSSTMIRTYADMGLDFSAAVPKVVAEYIQKNGLYKSELTALRNRISEVLEKKRFAHTLGVCETAVKMAKAFGEDIKKAYTAALLHDCAKNIPIDTMYQMCKEAGVELDEVEMEIPHLIHAKLGAYLTKTLYGIEDEDIINAVRWHTLGRLEMSKLEKIVYVADMAEPGRKFPWVENLRKTAYRDLDKAVYMCADCTVRFNEGRNNPVHKNAYEVRDYFKKLSSV